MLCQLVNPPPLGPFTPYQAVSFQEVEIGVNDARTHLRVKLVLNEGDNIVAAHGAFPQLHQNHHIKKVFDDSSMHLV